MKVSNIERKLNNLNARNMSIDISRTDWGWYVRMSSRLNNDYYDVEVTDQVSDKLHELTERQVLACFRSAEVSHISVKPYHDESDPMSDYCAWSFYRRVKDLDYINDRQLTRV